MSFLIHTVLIIVVTTTLVCGTTRLANNTKWSGPAAGMYLQVSQSGLDYITNIAQTALPQLVHNLSIPDSSAGGYTLKSLVINEFEAPNITARFIEGQGRIIRNCSNNKLNTI